MYINKLKITPQGNLRWLQIEQRNGRIFMRCKQRRYYVFDAAA